ncbi:hypothetical protein HID58_048372 [Brassica napus]|uniref:Uncharacterized protein n=1 Tax=Brassica napus TaxID=3708 RepID=A0ABQ8B1X9_BRANA|nr:hypothetical protein HID58_048372 [Brassica napus]
MCSIQTSRCGALDSTCSVQRRRLLCCTAKKKKMQTVRDDSGGERRDDSEERQGWYSGDGIYARRSSRSRNKKDEDLTQTRVSKTLSHLRSRKIAFGV